MPIAISDVHRDLESVARAALEKFGARGETRRLLDADEETMPPFWQDLVDLGWLGLHLPTEFDGGGSGLPELVVVVQEFGRSVAPGPYVPTVITSATIAMAGTAAQRSSLLPSFSDGTRTAGLGLGGNLELRSGVLEGDAGVVLGAGLANTFLLTVGDDIAIVDRDTPGLTVSISGNLDGGRRSGTIELKGVAVRDGQIVAGGARVFRCVARTLLAAEATGGAQECVDRATEYAKQRQQFGRTIGTFQAVKHHCANMLVASELATAAVWDAARAAGGTPDQFELASAVAAVQAIPAFLKNAQLNIQIHGGIGFTWEHDGHILLRRAATIAALVDVDGAAADVAAVRAAGTVRQLGLDLPPEAEALRPTVTAVAEEIAALPEDRQRSRLIETGYALPHWPKPWGRAAGALEQLVIDEEFAKAKINRPQYGITGWVILTLIQHGTPDQIERWVKPALEGEMVWCQLFSEPDAGSDAAAIRTKATRVDGGFLITGQKVWTSGAQYCHRGLATVRTNPDAPKHNGVTTVVIDMHAPGVEVRPLREASGASMFNEVFFNDVFVPDDDVVGHVDSGWTVARSTLGNERISIGSGGGGPGRAIDLLALLESHGRHVPGAAALVGAQLAEEQTLKVLNLRTAERAVAGGEPGPEGNVTKLVGAEHMQRSADLGLALLGPGVATLDGPGFTIGQTLIFSRAMTIAGGTSEITRNQIGERILGLPRDPLIR
jgi:alkylation response protein AidB-like acyl-CoA dehydrogenase